MSMSEALDAFLEEAREESNYAEYLVPVFEASYNLGYQLSGFLDEEFRYTKEGKEYAQETIEEELEPIIDEIPNEEHEITWGIRSGVTEGILDAKEEIPTRVVNRIANNIIEITNISEEYQDPEEPLSEAELVEFIEPEEIEEEPLTEAGWRSTMEKIKELVAKPGTMIHNPREK